MKKAVFLLLVFSFLFISVVFVNGADNPGEIETNEYGNLKLQVNLNSNIGVVGDVNELEARLSFYPRDDKFQKVTSKELKALPDGNVDMGGDESDEGEIVYRWGNVNADNVQINNKFIMDNNVNFNKINKKVKFPLENVDEYKEYLKSTQLINIGDKRIYQLAREIAEGEDDEYEVAFAIAEWINENVNYSLDTLTEKATKDSSWVLENKYGVCDEITVLYIAMMRSLGIPTKFVSGSSYSNLIDGFGNHAWAEVYFNGYGWVPFDVTYGQLGWVDSGHIKMDESYDAGKSSITYSWKTRNGDVKPGELDINVDVLEKNGVLDYDIGLNLEILDNKVRGGSFVPVRVEVENREDFYLPVSVYLVKGPKVVEDNSRDVLLKPHEKKRVFFLIEVPDNLNKNSLYTSEIEVKSSFNDFDMKILEYADIYDFELSREDGEKKLNELSEESSHDSGNIDVECYAGKEVYYKYELNGELNCEVRNLEGGFNGQICLFEDCRKINIGSGEDLEYKFSFNISNVKNELKVVITGDNIVKYGYVNVKILERPGIKVDDFVYPEEVGYNEESRINFTISSRDEIENLKVYLADEKIFDIESFVNVNDFSFNFNGKYFYGKKPVLRVTYEDRNNASYEYEQELQINLVDVPWYARILEWFKGLRRD